LPAMGGVFGGRAYFYENLSSIHQNGESFLSTFSGKQKTEQQGEKMGTQQED